MHLVSVTNRISACQNRGSEQCVSKPGLSVQFMDVGFGYILSTSPLCNQQLLISFSHSVVTNISTGLFRM